MDSCSKNILAPSNYLEFKEDTDIILRYKGLYKVTMGTEPKPNAIVEKSKYMNNLDEAYVFLCLNISKYLVFHLSGLKTPK